jgi:hypothetical protein
MYSDGDGLASLTLKLINRTRMVVVADPGIVMMECKIAERDLSSFLRRQSIGALSRLVCRADG